MLHYRLLLWLSGKESADNAGAAGDAGSIPGLRRFPVGEHGNPPQILAWRIPWTEEPGGLQFIDHKESNMNEATWQACIHIILQNWLSWTTQFSYLISIFQVPMKFLQIRALWLMVFMRKERMIYILIHFDCLHLPNKIKILFLAPTKFTDILRTQWQYLTKKYLH